MHLGLFRLADPGFLALLALAPLALGLPGRRGRKAGPSAGGLPCPGLGPDIRAVIPRTWAARVQPLLPWLKGAALVLLILALARPQAGTRRVDVLTEGVNVVLALDLSESMAAMDFTLDGRPVERADAVKKVVADFVRGRQGDRIALVVFGSQAYTQAPLTRDYDVILQLLDRLERGAAGPNTAIGDAVGIALKRMEDVKSASNVIVLLTDGESNSGELSPDAAAALARERGVRIHTVGVGGRGLAPFVVNTPFDRRVVEQPVNMDEEALKRMAAATGGLYFKAGDTEGLRTVYAAIDAQEKTTARVRTFDDHRDLYPHFLAPAFGLLGLWAALSLTRFRRLA